ncbi:LacI family DNA-binding transcriptional regulator [Kribbella sp. CA-245084]|uniref:LacI family DNA-binding transcriptional regulator n=1 Tax=Kribbella sp. CA-245084 TaxID=3239940 RepID=UPI003D8FDF1F
MTRDNGDGATTRTPAQTAVVTLRDVAKAAGVGLGTASRAMDPTSRYVTDDARSRVHAAATRLGYRPNSSARATTTGATPTIAMVVSDIRDPYNAQLVHGAISAARDRGLMVTITGTEHAADDEVRVIRMLRSQRPLALALAGARGGTNSSHAALLRELERYERDGGRIVVAGEDELPFDTAIVPRREGARALIATLAELGYRSVALIRPDGDSSGVRSWETGIAEGARRTGVQVDHVTHLRDIPMSREGGYAAATELLSAGRTGVDALVAATDTMALGAMAAMRAIGIAPGTDIGVAGFDDVVDADDVTPGLTSVNLALEAVGAAVVEMATSTPSETRRAKQFEARITVRASTPPRS